MKAPNLKISILINYLLIILLIWIVQNYFNVSDFELLISKLGQLRILLYVILFACTFILKAIRSTILIGRNVSFRKNVQLLAYGNMCNTILPARLGDLIRSTLLSNELKYLQNNQQLSEKETSKGFGSAISLIALEKIFDFTALLILGGIFFILLTNLNLLTPTILYIISISISLLVIAFIIIINARQGTMLSKFIKIIVQKFLPDSHSDRMLDVMVVSRETFYTELSNIKKTVSLLLFSLIIMFLDIYLFYIIASRLISVPSVLLLFSGVIGFLSIVFPSLPAGVGPYQFGIASVIFLKTNSLQQGLEIGFIELFLRSLCYITIGCFEILIHGFSNIKSILSNSKS